jgi:uncharacterized lipoprotein YmbA
MRRSIRFSQATEKTTDCHSEERKRRRISPHPLEFLSGAWPGMLHFVQHDKRRAQDDRKKLSAAFLPAVFLILVSIAGCPSFAPQPDHSRFFTLTQQVETESEAKNSGLDQVFLGVGPVRLPGYLDREELVTRVAQNRFEVAQNDRWIEPLEDNFSRVLAQDLYALLRNERIVRYPWPNSRKITHQVEIEVLRFEPAPGQEAHLAARWTLIDSATKQPLTIKTSSLKRPIKNPSKEATVDGLSEVLADFSREIADAIRAVVGQKK